MSFTVYFKLNGLGYNCGYDINNCPERGKSCHECIKLQLEKLGFEIDGSFEIFRIESYEKDLEMRREVIWNKFLDILNIKLIIIIDKESGLTILNYTVSDIEIDTNLLSGFIQANITFSESGNITKKNTNINLGNQYYEFQYESFNIFLKNGNFIRACLILDEGPSDYLKSQMFQFLYQFRLAAGLASSYATARHHSGQSRHHYHCYLCFVVDIHPPLNPIDTAGGHGAVHLRHDRLYHFHHHRRLFPRA